MIDHLHKEKGKNLSIRCRYPVDRGHTSLSIRSETPWLHQDRFTGEKVILSEEGRERKVKSWSPNRDPFVGVNVGRNGRHLYRTSGLRVFGLRTGTAAVVGAVVGPVGDGGWVLRVTGGPAGAG